MLIDSHTHTKYSKHASGQVEELVRSAINKGVNVLTITDHAPYPIDRNNRLLLSELDEYYKEVKRCAEKFKKDINVLVGLEVDYHRNYINFIKDIISRYDFDYILGAIHYVYINGERINTWDIEKLGVKGYFSTYISNIEEMTGCGLFDAIAHPDTLLSGDIQPKMFEKEILNIFKEIKNNCISYELNCSAHRKNYYNGESKNVQLGHSRYPSLPLIGKLNDLGVSFTIGSDSHTPEDVSSGIRDVAAECKKIGIDEVVYYKNRKSIRVKINNLLY